MLGRFLEVALLTDDPGADWSALQRLGFTAAATGDAWAYPYGVAACEGLAIGLHAAGEEPLSVVFVRPDVAALERELGARFLEVEHARLGSDVFNELGLREPGGILLRVVEARTFSPPPQPPARTALGRFLALSLPCEDLAAARGFWERLEMNTQAGSAPWESIAVQDLPIAYHGSGEHAAPLLLFDGAEALDDAALRAAGAVIARPLPALRTRPHRMLRGIAGLAALLLD